MLSSRKAELGRKVISGSGFMYQAEALWGGSGGVPGRATEMKICRNAKPPFNYCTAQQPGDKELLVTDGH